MRYLAILAIAFSLFSCTEQPESKPQEGIQVSDALNDCDKEKAKAKKDFDEGLYVILKFGMPADFEWEEFHHNYMLVNHGISVSNVGCVIDEMMVCYSDEMEELLAQKFGKDFLNKANDEAYAAYEKSKTTKHEVTTISGQIVEKEFMKKNNKPAGFSELYLRASIQDYYIKFCESKVSKEELEKYIDKGITVKVELIEGEWDICPDDPQEMQSRMGMYAAVLEIVD